MIIAPGRRTIYAYPGIEALIHGESAGSAKSRPPGADGDP